MPGVELGGLSGEAAKEVWLGPVTEARQRETHERMAKGWSKGMEMFPFTPHVPWTSLGQAPTPEQLEENDGMASG